MILQQLLLFAAGLGFGIISRFIYAAVTRLEKSIKLKPVTIIFDIVMTGLGVIAFTFMLFFLNDGAFMPFIFISSAAGFVLASLII